jgi:hypothetical protein
VQAEAIVERLKTLGYETSLTALKTPLEQALEELQQLGYAATLTQNGAPSGDENLDTESGFGVGERADAQDVFARAILEEAT